MTTVKQFNRNVEFNSTQAIIGNSGGAVYIAGGLNVSNLNVSNNVTISNLTITNNLFTSTGSSLISSQWVTVPAGISYTSGNIGIRTTSPGFALDISGGARITESLTTGSLNVVNGASITNLLSSVISTGTHIISGGGLIATFNSNTIGSIFTTGGNVGIGTTSPSSKLTVDGRIIQYSPAASNYSGYLNVNGTAQASTTLLNPGILLFSSLETFNYGIDIGNNGTFRTRLFAPNTADISFAFTPTSGSTSQNGFTEHMVIKGTTGNVGINTVSPAFTLDVSGTARINTTRGILIGTSNDIDNQRMISALNSGLPSGSTSYITLGVAATQNNQVEYAFTYTSTGSVLNCASIGVFGGDVRLNVNRNTVAIGTTTNSTSKLVIYESTGTVPSAIAGSLFIQRGNTGGSSSIVFPSVINSGSDYGYISYIDNVGAAGYTGYNYFNGGITAGGETSALLIGCENDPSTGPGPDSIIISPAGNVAITPRNAVTYISGNVGIGTTNPSFTLDVNGGGRFTGIVNNGSISQGNNSINFGTGAGANINWGDGPYTQIYDDSSLHIWTDDSIFFDRGGSTNGLAGKPTGFTTWLFNNGGNVGINTTVPTQTLDVNGTIARSGVRLPRFDNGTFSAASAAVIPILFSDTTYNYVEVKVSYQVSTGASNVVLAGNKASNGAGAAANLSEYSEITTLWNAGTGGNIRTTSAYISQNTESLGITSNFNIKITRAVANGGLGSGSNHYMYDTVYCWAGTGTARVYGQGHMDTDNTQSVNQLLSILMTPSAGTITGTWSAQHSY